MHLKINNKYKNIILLIILCFSFNLKTFAEESKPLVINNCYVKNEFYECLNANWLNKNWIPTWELPTNRMIDDFICISEQNDTTKILENIILDKEFKKVEKDMKTFLENLTSQRLYYFSKWSNNNEITWIDDITKIFWENYANTEVFNVKYWSFYKRFNNLCNHNWIFYKIMECKWVITNINAVNTIQNNWNILNTNECMRLAKTKLDIYENIAQNILKINKAKAKRDNIDRYNKKLNKQYDDLFQMFIKNVDYLWTILNNWVSKTRKCFWG